MYKAVIFDWGGVIAADSGAGMHQRVARLAGVSAEALKPHFRDPFRRFRKNQIDEAEFWQQLETSLGYQLPPAKHEIWSDPSGTTIQPVMEDFVKELQARGLRTALLSNIVPSTAARIRQKGGYTLFDPVVLSCEHGTDKPNLELYQIMLDALKLPPKACIYVDDLPHNLPPAQQLGMAVFLARNPKQIIKGTNALLSKSTDR